MKALTVFLGCCLLLPTAAHAAAPGPDRWQVSAAFDARDESWTLRWCAPSAGQSLQLRADDAVAMQRLGSVMPEPDRRGERTLSWSALATPCATLVYDLGAVADSRRSDVGYRVGDDLLSWSGAWWWRQTDSDQAADLTVTLPAGWQASTPFPSCGTTCWRMGTTPPSWPALVALGRFPVVATQMPGGRIDAALLGQLDATQKSRLEEAARGAAAQIEAAYGRLPVPRLQMLLVPMPRGRGGDDGDAISFGQLFRGGLGGVNLFVNPDADAAAFASNWVLPHELSHLLHPYLGEGRGRWLSEGLASYYQNILRGRTGRLSIDKAWEQLLQGFERGRRDRYDISLDQLVGDMRQRRAFMRIYWSGAAFWLQADLALRARGSSLDQVLEAFGKQNLPATRSWTPERFLAALDGPLDRPLLAPLAEGIGGSAGFPELSDALRKLDLDPAQPVLDLQQKAAAGRLREAIMGRRP